MTETKRAVVLAGGWAHPPDDIAQTMTQLIAARSFDVDVITEPGDVGAAVAGAVDLLVVSACWFAMTHERYTQDQRERWAVHLDDAATQGLTRLKEAGCPLLAVHTAPICFDGWPLWHDWLGGTWDWASSWHPEPSLLSVEIVSDSPVSLAGFSVVDEEYQELIVDTDVDLVARTASGHPVVWLKNGSSGRSAVNLLGHDSRSLDDAAHRSMNEALVDWLTA